MILAALGDIQGNLPAFQAVLRHIDEAGIQTLLNTGNSVGCAPWPCEVLELLRARRTFNVLGHLDRSVTQVFRKAASLKKRLDSGTLARIQWSFDHLPSREIEWIKDLPQTTTLRLENTDICLCHGALDKPFNGLGESDPVERFQRQREIAPVPLLVGGNTPQPFSRLVDGTWFVNPGAVGGLQTDEAVYTTIDTEVLPWRIVVHRVSYDVQAVRDAIASVGLPLPGL